MKQFNLRQAQAGRKLAMPVPDEAEYKVFYFDHIDADDRLFVKEENGFTWLIPFDKDGRCLDDDEWEGCQLWMEDGGFSLEQLIDNLGYKCDDEHWFVENVIVNLYDYNQYFRRWMSLEGNSKVLAIFREIDARLAEEARMRLNPYEY